jgi:hypothetical protein
MSVLKTMPNCLWITTDDNKDYLDEVRNTEDSKNSSADIEKQVMVFSMDNHSFDPRECYFDEGQLSFSGELKGMKGTTFVTMEIPISDDMLTDILTYGIKKLNRLKTALETLK